MTTFASSLLVSVLLAQAGLDRADVTFINGTQFTVSVFLKSDRKMIGPISSGDFIKIEKGFALGENDYLVLREVGDRRSLREFVAGLPGRHRLYPSSAGRGPAPVLIELTDKAFRVGKNEASDASIKVENNTSYPIMCLTRGQSSGFGPIFAGKTRTFSSTLPYGKAELIVVAYGDARPDGRLSDDIVHVAFVSITVKKGSSGIPTLVVGDTTFGPRGLPPKQSVTPAPIPKLGIEGKWRMPDGLSVRFEGTSGYWIEVKHLAEFGFKPGDLGFRGLKELPDKPGTFIGEVLYRFLGGAEDGWRPFTVTIRDRNTLNNASGDWKRID